MLRGIDKVETEIGLVALAHNFKKATLRAEGPCNPILSRVNNPKQRNIKARIYKTTLIKKTV